MRFQEYLTENRSKKINNEDAFKLAKECKHAINTYLTSGEVLRRGLHVKGDPDSTRYMGDYLMVEPKKFRRKSAYVGSNYYTLLMDNLPSWKQYPKRSQSIVCDTGYHHASDYSVAGNLYYVFPVNGSKVGVAPEDDIFSSFDFAGMNWFSNRMGASGFDDRSWKALVKSFQEFDDASETERNNSIFDVEDINDEYNGNLLDTLNIIMDPKKNGFTLRKAGYKYDDEWNEAWTDGKCLLVNESAMTGFQGLLEQI